MDKDKATPQVVGGGADFGTHGEFVTFDEMACRKLDALTELVEAMAAAMTDPENTSHVQLERVLARRWGFCELCLGTGNRPYSGQPPQRCMPCNGTGKAQGEPDA